MRPLKLAALVLGGLIAILVLGALALLLLFDPNSYRDSIEREVGHRTGRVLHIGGPLSLRLLPFLAVGVRDVTLGNPAAARPYPGNFLELKEASLGLRLLPLLQHRIEITRVRVAGLSLHLESRSPTDNNWQDLSKGSPDRTPPSPSGSRPVQLGIDALEIQDCSLDLRDEVARSTTSLRDIALTATHLGGSDPAPVRLAFTYRGGDAPPWRTGLDGRLAMGPDAIALTDLKLRANEVALTGSLSLTLANLASRFDLASHEIDLDRLLGAPAPAAAPTPAAKAPKKPIRLPIDALRKLETAGRLRIDTLRVRGLELTQLDLNVKAHAGLVQLEPLLLRLYGGSARGGIEVDARPQPAQLRVKQQVGDVSVGPLTAALFGSQRLSGRAAVDLDVNGRGDTDSALLRTLAGPLNLRVRDGALEGIDLAHQLDVASALLGGHAPAGSASTGRTPFTALQAIGAVRDGVLHEEDLQLATPVFQVSGKGSLDLSTQALDFKLDTHAGATSPAGRAPGAASMTVPILIAGTLAAPVVRPDVDALARDQLGRRLGAGKEELQHALGDRLKGLLGR